MAITGTNLYNLTKKREGARKAEFALRQNPTATLGGLPVQSNRASQRNRQAYGPYVERVRAPNEALPRTIVQGQGLYDGAELRPYQGRPGAMDFKALPSRGL